LSVKYARSALHALSILNSEAGWDALAELPKPILIKTFAAKTLFCLAQSDDPAAMGHLEGMMQANH